MKLEEELSGPTPSAEEIAKALSSLVNTPTPHDRARVLQQQSALVLTDQALELLDRNIERATEKADSSAVGVFQDVRYRIELARSRGLEVAVASLELQPFVDAGSWAERKEILEKNADVLLSPSATQAIQELLEINQHSPAGVALLGAISAVLNVARQNGIKEAIDWLRHQLLANVARLMDEKQMDSAALLIREIYQLARPDEWLEVNKRVIETVLSRSQRTDDLRWLVDLVVENLSSAPSVMVRAELEVTLGSALLGFENGELIERATELLEKALSTFETGGARVHGLLGTVGRAYMLRKSGDHSSNLKTARDYLERELETTDPANSAVTQRLLGDVSLQLSERESAIAHWATSLESEPEGPDERQAQVGFDLAQLRMKQQGPGRQSAIELAISDLKQAATKALETSALWARIQGTLGQIYRERKSGDPSKNLETATVHTKQALSVYTRRDYPNEWAEMQHNLGTLYYSNPGFGKSLNIERAIIHYNRALTVHTKAAHPQSYGLTCSALGLAFIARAAGDRRRNLSQALELLKEAEATLEAQKAKFATWLAEAWTGIGMIHYELTDDERDNAHTAAEYLEKARKAYHDLENQEREKITLSNLAAVYTRISEFDRSAAHKAIECVKEALNGVDEKSDPYYWAHYNRNLGAAIFNKGDLTEKDISSILEALQNALEVFTPDTYLTDYRTTQNHVGSIYFLVGDWELAIEAYSSVIVAGERSLASAYTEPDRRAIVRETEAAYLRTAYSLIQLRRFDEALIAIESGKARLLRDSLSNLDDLDGRAPKELVEQLRKGHAMVRALEGHMRQAVNNRSLSVADIGQRLVEARTNLEKLTNEIQKHIPDFSESIDDISDLLEQIPPEGALVAFLATSEGGFAIVVDAAAQHVEAKHIVPLPLLTIKAIEHMINSWMRVLEGGASLRTANKFASWIGTQQTSMKNLWGLTDPIYRKLVELGIKPQSTVLMLPQGGLWLVPFHAASREVESQQRVLADDYTIIQTPSMYVRKLSLSKKDQRTALQPKLLAVVDPSGNLPFADEEVTTVASYFRDPTLLDADTATKKAVLEASKETTYLHCACHGRHSWSDPMNSGLQLASEDWLLLTSILAELDISSNRLVVLSACESGLADLAGASEEFVGLPTGFLLAGATGVISSLWKVHDAATYLLMAKFYALHMKGQEPPHAALLKAQQWLRDLTAADLAKLGSAGQMLIELYPKEVIKNSPDKRLCDYPFFWAGFIFVGA